MDPTTLEGLMDTNCVTCSQNNLLVAIPSSWIVDGEDRLSYTTLIRLIECCREYHWKRDILDKINTENVQLDSISKSLICEFLKPILVGSKISISYCVEEIRHKGYSLRFEVRNIKDQNLYAKFDLVSIFYDPVKHKIVTPPPFVLDCLSCHQCEEVKLK